MAEPGAWGRAVALRESWTPSVVDQASEPVLLRTGALARPCGWPGPEEENGMYIGVLHGLPCMNAVPRRVMNPASSARWG